MARIIPSIFLLLCLRLVFPLLFWLYLSTFLYLYVYLSLSLFHVVRRKNLSLRERKKDPLCQMCAVYHSRLKSLPRQSKAKKSVIAFFDCLHKVTSSSEVVITWFIRPKKPENWISHLNQWRCDHSPLKLTIKLRQTWISFRFNFQWQVDQSSCPPIVRRRSVGRLTTLSDHPSEIVHVAWRGFDAGTEKFHRMPSSPARRSTTRRRTSAGSRSTTKNVLAELFLPPEVAFVCTKRWNTNEVFTKSWSMYRGNLIKGLLQENERTFCSFTVFEINWLHIEKEWVNHFIMVTNEN